MNIMSLKCRAGVFRRSCLLLGMVLPSCLYADIFLRMQTDLGAVDMQLYELATPATVVNFMNYVNDGDYEGTFIHRSVPGFVVQMGGYVFDPSLGSFTNNSGIYHIPVDPPVANDPGIPNTRGTIAMARLTDPDSATSEFFFNLVDNSGSLDTLNGGYTVFGEVLGDGMEVIDRIAALERCLDIGYALPRPCNNYPETPLIGIEAPDGTVFSSPVEQANLVNLNNIGIDSDGDGIIDPVEDAAPNNGDANEDGIDDRDQAGVASFATLTGSYVLLEASAGDALQGTQVLGQTFAMTTVDPFDPNNDLAGLEFLQGLFGTGLGGLAPGGAAVITLTIPAADTPNGFYMYGPTASDATPHWYSFLYDGQTATGAAINGNVITLHFVDGGRGDADLQANGMITTAIGGAAIVPGDRDGIPDAIENGAPNNGDANEDGILDSTQDSVVSLMDLRGTYLTLEARPSSTALRSVAFSSGAEYLAQAPDPEVLSGLNFAHGFLGFEARGLVPGAAVDVRLILPPGEAPVKYFKFGPTPGNTVPHLYEFTLDGATGAEMNNRVITLHLVDGGRGDSDLSANGNIVDPGAPALVAEISDSDGGGGGGCSVNNASRPSQAGAWWLLLLLACLDRLRRRCCRAFPCANPGGTG